jgi:hypothetical protein
MPNLGFRQTLFVASGLLCTMMVYMAGGAGFLPERRFRSQGDLEMTAVTVQPSSQCPVCPDTSGAEAAHSAGEGPASPLAICQDKVMELEAVTSQGGRGMCQPGGSTASEDRVTPKPASPSSLSSSSPSQQAPVHIQAPRYEPLLDTWLFPVLPDGVRRKYHEPESWKIAWNMTWKGHEGIYMPKKYGSRFNSLAFVSYVHDTRLNVHRLYYRCNGHAADKICFAVSTDGGLTFTSPEDNMVRVPKDNAKFNNIVVTYDQNPATPLAERYKLLAGHQNILAWISGDGVDWIRYPKPIRGVGDDTRSYSTCSRAYYDGPSSLIWNKRKARYDLFFRTNLPGKSCNRWVGKTHRQQWGTGPSWATHRRIIRGGAPALWEESMYNAYPVEVPGNSELLLIMTMRARRSALVGRNNYASDFSLLATRDPELVAWETIDTGSLFLTTPFDSTQNGRSGVRRTWPVAGGLVQHVDGIGRRMWSLLVQNIACFRDIWDKTRGFKCDDHPYRGAVFRAEYVAGRIASIGTDLDFPLTRVSSGAPLVTTRPFTTDAKVIAINCATSAFGFVAYALVRASDGKEIKGYGLADSRLLFGSVLEYPLLWGKSSELPASIKTEPVHLVLSLSKAEVFSINFSNTSHTGRPREEPHYT